MVKRRARVHGRRLSLRSDGYGRSGGRFVCHEVSSDRRRHVEGHTLIRLVLGFALRGLGGVAEPRLEGDGFEPLVLRDNDPFSAVAPEKLLGRDREFADSLLEGAGFEPSVPLVQPVPELG
jgi:hypothetical protein